MIKGVKLYKINVVGLIKKLRIESIEKERQRRRDLKEEYEVYIGKTMRLFIIRKGEVKMIRCRPLFIDWATCPLQSQAYLF